MELYGHFPKTPLQNSMLKHFGSHMTVLYPNPCYNELCYKGTAIYYIHINDTTFEVSVFWPSDTGNRINELRFSDSVSYPLKRV